MDEKERLYNLLKEAFFLLDDGDRRLFSQFDLTVSRFYALYHIGAEPGISMKHLSDRMLCDKSNVTRIIKGLEAREFIFRTPHETDGRTQRLYLTEIGESIREKVVAAHKNYNEIRLDCLNDLEHSNLMQGLSRLNHRLRSALYTHTST